MLCISVIWHYQGTFYSSRYDNPSAAWVYICSILMFFMVSTEFLMHAWVGESGRKAWEEYVFLIVCIYLDIGPTYSTHCESHCIFFLRSLPVVVNPYTGVNLI